MGSRKSLLVAFLLLNTPAIALENKDVKRMSAAVVANVLTHIESNPSSKKEDIKRFVSRTMLECSIGLRSFNAKNEEDSGQPKIAMLADIYKSISLELVGETEFLRVIADASDDNKIILNLPQNTAEAFFKNIFNICAKLTQPDTTNEAIAESISLPELLSSYASPRSHDQAPTLGSAFEGRKFLYREMIESVYWNDWSGSIVSNQETGQVDIYISGKGKTSNFSGVLSINCESKSGYYWKTASNFSKPLSAADIKEQVPIEIISRAKKLFCVSR